MEDLKNKILINVENDETRIALLHGSKLENLHVEQTNRAQKVGNIYCGKVIKIQPSFQAAFIDYGEERQGFLSISDINYQVYKPNREGRGRTSISQVLKPGQKVIVQVIKDEIAHKGASLTTNISIAGRFLVFMPDSDRGGVSKKIEDEEQRSRLRHLLKGLGNENSSAIIRTVGVDRSLTELKRDYTILRKTWLDIKNEYDSKTTPGLLFQEEDSVLRMIRDYYNENVIEVIIDEPIAFQHTLEFFQTHLQSEQKKLQLYLGEKSLFSQHGIESQIEILDKKQVPLPSGGSLVIMPTEALVAIDVNSGKSAQEKNIEATAVRTNLEAAEEIPRQLRLRNLGGLIVIDFIDMDNSKNRLLVEEKIEEAMTIDKAKTSFGIISKFGLLELSRQRISSSLANNSKIITLGNRILRKIHDCAIEKKLSQVQIRLPLELASHLLNAKRQKLNQIEMDYGLTINIVPDIQLGPHEIPELEIFFQDFEGVENRTSIPVDSTEKISENKNLKKELKDKLNEKKDHLDYEHKSSENKVQNKISKEIETKNTSTLKEDNFKKTSKRGRRKKESLNSNAEGKKVNDDSPELDYQNDYKTTKNPREIDSNVQEVNPGTIFISSHESLSLSDFDKSTEPTIDSIVKEETNSIATYESIHIDNQIEYGNKKNFPGKDVLNEDYKETPMFNSIHLDDIVNKTKKLTKKTKNKSKVLPKETTPISVKNPEKKSPRTSKSKDSNVKGKKSKKLEGNSLSKNNDKKFLEGNRKSKNLINNELSNKKNAEKIESAKLPFEKKEVISKSTSDSKIKKKMSKNSQNDSKKTSKNKPKTKESAA